MYKSIKIFNGDIVQLFRSHSCGEDCWEVLHQGLELRLRCLGCQQTWLVPCNRLLPRIKDIRSAQETKPKVAA